MQVDAARRQLLAGVPDDGAGARQAAGEMTVEHRPARQHDGRDVDGGRPHDHGRRGLVAAGGQHDAVEEVAVQALDQAEIGEVAVERGGRPLAGLLDRMDRELDRDAAGIADAVAHARRQVEVMAVAGREVAAGLGDADDRPAAMQLGQGQAEIHVALEIERRHGRVARRVEPVAAAQPALAVALAVGAFLVGHRRSSDLLVGATLEKAAPKSSAPCHAEEALPPWRHDQGCILGARDMHKCRIRACCHPVAQLRDLCCGAQRPARYARGDSRCSPFRRSVGAPRPLSPSPSPPRPAGWRGRGRSRRRPACGRRA